MSITLIELHAKQNDYCVIVGVKNEGERFTHQLDAMNALALPLDIIIADGGSTDGATSESALQNKARALLVDRRGLGLSAQYQAALQFALTAGYQGAIMIDGNGKDGVEALPRFVQALRDGYDLVQGSRFLKGGSYEHTPIVRSVGIRILLMPVMWLGSGRIYTDPINGFKGISRVLLEHSDMQIFRPIFRSYSLQYYLNYRAPRLGLRVTEIPVKRDYPAGPVPTKITGLNAHLKIIWTWFMVCAGRYNPR